MIGIPEHLSSAELLKRLGQTPEMVHLVVRMLNARCRMDCLEAFAVGPGVAAASLGRNATLILPPLGEIPLSMSFITCQDSPFHGLTSAGKLMTASLRAMSAELAALGNQLSPLQQQLLLEQEHTQLEADLVNHDVLKQRALVNEANTRDIVDKGVSGATEKQKELFAKYGEQERKAESSRKQNEADFAQRLVASTGLKYNMLQFLGRPLVMASELNDALLKIWHKRSYDSQVILNLSGLAGLEEVFHSRHKEALLSFLQQSLRQPPDLYVYGDALIPKPALSMFLSLQPHEFHQLVKRKEALEAGILSNAILLSGKIVGTSGPLPEAQEELFAALQAELRDLRLEPLGRPVRCSPEAVERFLELQELCDAQAEAFVLPGYGRIYAQRPLQAVKLAASWTLFTKEQVVSREWLELAFDLIEYFRYGNEGFLEEVLCTPVSDVDGDEALHRMIEKLKRKGGGLTRRQLYRCYEKQQKGLHEPTLEKGLRLGLIEEREALLYAAGSGGDCQYCQGESAVSEEKDVAPETAEIP